MHYLRYRVAQCLKKYFEYVGQADFRTNSYIFLNIVLLGVIKIYAL